MADVKGSALALIAAASITATDRLIMIDDLSGTPTTYGVTYADVRSALLAGGGSGWNATDFLALKGAIATPSALAATQFTAFASTVSGAAIMGFGTTNDVALMNRAGTVVLGIGPNTTAVNMAGTLLVSGAVTHSSTLLQTGLATFNGGATIASGQTLTVTGATITGLTAASVATGTFPGVYTVTGALTLSAALTYGGVTLSNAVTGTGNMVLSAGPTLTGTLTVPTIKSAAGADLALGTTSAGTALTFTSASGNATFGGVAVSGITTLATTSTINGQTISSAANFTGTAAFAGAVTISVGDQALNVLAASGASKAAFTRYTGTTAGSAVQTYYIGTNPFLSDGSLEIKSSGGQGAQMSFAGLWTFNSGLSVSSGTTAVQALTATTYVGSSTMELQNQFSSYHANSSSGAGWGFTSLTDGGSVKNSIGTFGIFQDGATQRSGFFQITLGNSGAPAEVFRIAKTGAATFTAGISATTGTFTGLIQTTVTTEQMRLRYDASHYMRFSVNSAGTGVIDAVGNNDLELWANGTQCIVVTNTAVAGDMNLKIGDVSAGLCAQVSRGALDSGGAGFRLLRVPN